MPIDKKKRNFLSTPNQFYSELTESDVKHLCSKDITKKLSYPLYLDLSNEKFQLTSIESLKIIKGACIKELDIR